jgi:hypothetical protein
MKTRLLFLILLLSLGTLGISALGQVPEGSVILEIVTTPEPAYNQLEYGENYQFNVLVKNLNLDLEEDDFIDPSERDFRFSGNLVVRITFTVGKEGILHVGPNSQSYKRDLLEWDTSDDVDLPEIGGSSSLPFQYNTTTMGYGSRVGVNEWVTFTVETKLYVEQYIESEGEKRYDLDLMGEQTQTFYLISRSKIDYVGDVLDAVDWELSQAKITIAQIEGQLGDSLDVDLSRLETIQSTMVTTIEAGDYVTAMAFYDGYEPVWRDNLEETLLEEAERARTREQALESTLEDASSQLEELTQDFQTIEAALQNATASHRQEIQELEDALSTATTNGRLYIFGIVIALAGIVVVFLRSRARRSLSG